MDARFARALANAKRILILEWLKDPVKHFRPQKDGDLAEDRVCGVLIAEKLEVTQPTASEHLRILVDAGLLKSKKIKQWIFYQRSAAGIRAARRAFTDLL